MLIIDDEPANIKALEMIMAGQYDVCSAMRGKEGIELATKEPKPDLIMLDIQMPGMDGYDVIKRLKQNPETRDIPVIFNSILSDEGTEQNVLDLGAVDYIRKPFHHVVTLARIRTHLRLKQALTTLTDHNAKLERLLNLREGVDRLAKHDLKLPIGAIISSTEELLERQDLGQAARLPIKTIMSQSYHALDMVNRSMDLWKIEQGAYKYIPAKVDIMKVLRRAVMEMESLRKENEIKIQILYSGAVAMPKQELMVMGEEWLFHSMVANLVKNSLEAAPRGSRVSISVQETNGLRIEIHNLGAVPVEVRGNFFEKHSSFGKGHGAGLGAYIAMKIAQTLGLMIRMDTSGESGTTLALYENEPS
ncbi:MAG: hybrid sensor histidine kinase/response regulator [Nitrospinota bacterium]|nr:hybrid sensor histidine kinase/response regulator [Nitrospinota bacterium]